MTTKHPVRSAITGLIAGGAALLLAFGGGHAANATTSDALIPENATGTVTIHKHEQSSTIGEAATGAQLDAASEDALGAGIAGVTFSATKVPDIDLSTNAGWAAASELTAEDVLDTDLSTAPVSEADTTANATGTYEHAVFADLEVGLYLFQETDAPAGVTKSDPWLMTVPLTHPTELDSWLYDIHVYPKNSTSAATMSVQDASAVKLGDEFTWTIISDLPRVADSSTQAFLAPTKYEVVDQLDPRLTYGGVEVSLIGTDTTTLTAEDFVVDAPARGNNNTLTVTFTETGLAKLGQAASLDGVQVQVDVNTSANAAGEISNKATISINNAAVLETNEAATHWGDVFIHKIDEADNELSLAGATFELYATEGDAKAGSNPITIKSQAEFTTGENGTVRIPGVRYSDFADGAPVDGGRTYYLVETKAPEGYELLADPMPINVAMAGQTLDSTAGVTVVENAKHNAGFQLPLTGATGTWMFTVGGLALLAGGLLLALRKKKDSAS